MRLFYTIIFIILLFILSNIFCYNNQLLYAKDTANCAGTEFLLCFPQNGNTIKEQPTSLVLLIYISSYDGSICHYDIRYFINDTLISIKDSIYGEQIETINIPIELEVKSFKENEKKGIFINSDNPINVYAISKQRATSDAFLCYPTNILDTSYIIASYKNKLSHLIGDPRNHYSAITIVALEDNTIVEIIPTAPLADFENEPLQTVTIKLNKGETRQVIAKITKPYDLTGSIINSNKKIVVYSTHNDTSIKPKDYTFGTTDVLIKQTLPISRLGSNAIFSPLIHPNYNNLTLGRIISPFDKNAILFPDTTIYLNKYEFYEFEFDTATFIQTTKPALFAEYGFSSNNGDFADPLLLLLPPIENYLNKYLFKVPDFLSLKKHYINVIIDTIGKKSLEIDNTSLADINSYKITGTSLIYFNLQVEPGNHLIKSDSAFGLIIHGYGGCEGYGYIPNMKTDRKIDYYLDKIPPKVSFYDDCIKSIIISDEGKYKTGIKSFNIIEKNNIEIIKTDINDIYAEKYLVELIDPLKDGKLLFEITDIAGNKKIDSIEAKGFTIINDEIEKNNVKFLECQCDTIKLNNFGNFKQSFRAFFYNNLNFSVPLSQNYLELEPNQSGTLITCIFSNNLLGEIFDTLYLIDECDRIMKIPYQATIEPNYYEEQIKCGTKLKLVTSNKYINNNKNKLIINNFTGNIKIFDILGNIILQKDYYNTNSEETLNINNGIYFIMIYDDKGIVETKKITIIN